ncbi:hypothetical protein [Denitrobaculum tricleocarpae]|uniref:Uncharacterized protein n=1 Tax=Denitrobaculum tricleocarpae TaxID=2591009 RepID=A0A545TSV9_9PROT|nr:hypothetical protein [Denitrobaculum tricleocarpae]TQV80315.1 hypothetical protein FKG95_08965 [Denitrobaculum tricleocarpae]
MQNNMSALRVRPVDVGGSIGKGLQIKNAMSEMKERDRLQKANAAFAESFADGMPTDPAGRQAMVAKAAQVNPKMAFDASTYLSNMDATTRAREIEEAGILNRSFKNVKDPQSYAAVRQGLLRIGINDIPEVYNPNEVANVLAMSQAIMAPQEGFTLSQGQQRFNVDGTPVASVAPKSKLLSDAELKQKMQVAQAGKTDIDLGTQEKEEQKQRGKFLVENFSAISERASAAEQTLQQLAIARAIPVETGAAAPMKAAIGAYARALGFEPEAIGLDQASSAQAFTGIMNNLVLTKMQAQKGPQTENDAARIEATLARLGNTPEANDFLFRSAEALERRAVEQRRFYESHFAANGTYDGAGPAWDKFKVETPLVGTNPKSGVPVFFHEFAKEVMRVNRGATQEQILDLWKSKYD